MDHVCWKCYVIMALLLLLKWKSNCLHQWSLFFTRVLLLCYTPTSPDTSSTNDLYIYPFLVEVNWYSNNRSPYIDLIPISMRLYIHHTLSACSVLVTVLCCFLHWVWKNPDKTESTWIHHFASHSKMYVTNCTITNQLQSHPQKSL